MRYTHKEAKRKVTEMPAMLFDEVKRWEKVEQKYEHTPICVVIRSEHRM